MTAEVGLGSCPQSNSFQSRGQSRTWTADQRRRRANTYLAHVAAKRRRISNRGARLHVVVEACLDIHLGVKDANDKDLSAFDSVKKLGDGRRGRTESQSRRSSGRAQGFRGWS